MPITPLDASESPAATEVLTRAFADNPGMCAVAAGDDHEARVRMLRPCMKGFVKATLRYGSVEVIRGDGGIVAVSLSFGPGQYPMPLLGQLAVARAPAMIGLRRALRFARIDGETRRRHPHPPHFYLWFLGVDPDQQGKGFGSELLRALTARADAARVPCYLETDKTTSVRLYEKHGFQVKEQVRLPVLDVDFWFMPRPAAGVSG
jgi:ribosomal protein S18 acetylase RimI-like enzyme